MEISIVPSIPLMATTGAVGVIVGVVIAFVWLRISARSANAASAEELLNYLVIVLQPALGGKFVPVMGIVSKVLEAADAVAGVMDETALNEEIQKACRGFWDRPCGAGQCGCPSRPEDGTEPSRAAPVADRDGSHDGGGKQRRQCAGWRLQRAL